MERHTRLRDRTNASDQDPGNLRNVAYGHFRVGAHYPSAVQHADPSLRWPEVDDRIYVRPITFFSGTQWALGWRIEQYHRGRRQRLRRAVRRSQLDDIEECNGSTS